MAPPTVRGRVGANHSGFGHVAATAASHFNSRILFPVQDQKWVEDGNEKRCAAHRGMVEAQNPRSRGTRLLRGKGITDQEVQDPSSSGDPKCFENNSWTIPSEAVGSLTHKVESRLRWVDGVGIGLTHVDHRDAGHRTNIQKRPL